MRKMEDYLVHRTETQAFIDGAIADAVFREGERWADWFEVDEESGPLFEEGSEWSELDDLRTSLWIQRAIRKAILNQGRVAASQHVDREAQTWPHWVDGDMVKQVLEAALDAVFGPERTHDEHGVSDVR